MSDIPLPRWLPASAGTVDEEVAQATLRQLQRCQVHVPLLQRSLLTVYMETAAATSAAAAVAAAGKGSLGGLTCLTCSMLRTFVCTRICMCHKLTASLCPSQQTNEASLCQCSYL